MQAQDMTEALTMTVSIQKKKKSDLVELLRTVSWDWGGEEVDRGELLLRHEWCNVTHFVL